MGERGVGVQHRGKRDEWDGVTGGIGVTTNMTITVSRGSGHWLLWL